MRLGDIATIQHIGFSIGYIEYIYRIMLSIRFKLIRATASAGLLAVGFTLAATDASAAAASSGTAFGSALLFAFIGGIILNLMPCVFPVLSIKALALVEMPRENRSMVLQSGLLYTAGILVAFVAIGGALVGLRAAGHGAGWGFQLQNPAINLVLGLLMLAIGLNLLGVFEIGGRITGVGQALTGGGERRAAFFTGLLAVLVATPCTAPFMAGALGYALVQPAGIALAVFLSLGLGLAAPYLLISVVPAFGRMLPRPGPWLFRCSQPPSGFSGSSASNSALTPWRLGSPPRCASASRCGPTDRRRVPTGPGRGGLPQS